MTGIARDLFAQLADQLIPPAAGFPAPSSIGVHREGLDRLAQVRPDLIGPLTEALELFAESDLSEALALREIDPAAFRALSASVAGIYLTDPRVTAAYGYPGRQALDVGDCEQRTSSYLELVRPVLERGFVWATTPDAVSSLPREASAIESPRRGD